MKEVPHISDTEWQVMKVIWEKAPVTANDIINALEDKTDWKPKTVKTLIGRLVKKKAAGYREDPNNCRAYIYFPIVNQDECIEAESHLFLNRFFGGKMNVMIASFLDDKKLSTKDLDELKKLIDEKDGKG